MGFRVESLRFHVEGSSERDAGPPLASQDPACSRGLDQFENNFFADMCNGSDADPYLRLIHLLYQSTLRFRVMKKRKKVGSAVSFLFISLDTGLGRFLSLELSDTQFS